MTDAERAMLFFLADQVEEYLLPPEFLRERNKLDELKRLRAAVQAEADAIIPSSGGDAS